MFWTISAYTAVAAVVGFIIMTGVWYSALLKLNTAAEAAWMDAEFMIIKCFGVSAKEAQLHGDTQKEDKILSLLEDFECAESMDDLTVSVGRLKSTGKGTAAAYADDRNYFKKANEMIGRYNAAVREYNKKYSKFPFIIPARLFSFYEKAEFEELFDTEDKK